MVLPFENGSGDPAQDIFVRGITEDVIGALISFKNVLVFGADTSFRNFRIWEAEANPDWTKNKTALPPPPAK